MVLSVQFSPVTQSCPTLWNPMDHSTSGLPVHHQLPEFTQTHVHWVSDAIQPSHPLSSPSPSTFSLSQHQGLFKWVSSSHQVAKALEFHLQHQSFQWTLRTDLLYDGLVGSPCSPRDSQESSPTPQFKSINSSVLGTSSLTSRDAWGQETPGTEFCLHAARAGCWMSPNQNQPGFQYPGWAAPAWLSLGSWFWLGLHFTLISDNMSGVREVGFECKEAAVGQTSEAGAMVPAISN